MHLAVRNAVLKEPRTARELLGWRPPRARPRRCPPRFGCAPRWRAAHHLVLSECYLTRTPLTHLWSHVIASVAELGRQWGVNRMRASCRLNVGKDLDLMTMELEVASNKHALLSL